MNVRVKCISKQSYKFERIFFYILQLVYLVFIVNQSRLSINVMPLLIMFNNVMLTERKLYSVYYWSKNAKKMKRILSRLGLDLLKLGPSWSFVVMALGRHTFRLSCPDVFPEYSKQCIFSEICISAVEIVLSFFV